MLLTLDVCARRAAFLIVVSLTIASSTPVPVPADRETPAFSNLRINTLNRGNEANEIQTSRLARLNDAEAQQGSQTARPRRIRRESGSGDGTTSNRSRYTSQGGGSRSSAQQQEAPVQHYQFQTGDASHPSEQPVYWSGVPQWYDDQYHSQNAPSQAESSSQYTPNVPVYHDFFTQQPEGIAIRRQRASSHGSHEMDYNVSDFHRGLQQDPAIGAYYHHHQDEAQQEWEHPQHVVADGEAHHEPHEPLIWSKRNTQTKADLVEIVSKERCLRNEDVRAVLKDNLTKLLAKRLKSRDPAVVTSTINYLFPITDANQVPVWMNSLSERGSGDLVQRMMDITGQRRDLVRNAFLRAQLQPGVAAQLLWSDDDTKAHYAKQIGLLPPHSEKDDSGNWERYLHDITEHPWQYGLNQRERDRVVYAVVGGLKTDSELAMAALCKPNVWPGFGRALLDGDHETCAALLDQIRD
ncbi:hypothetical protein CBS101457_003012 [Exobasidium rhododendri]|nr:hypothetical protein CBS101457_003012 [Exobasidium rhododendri]